MKSCPYLTLNDGVENPQHMRENFDIFDFALAENEMQEMEALDRGKELFHSMKWMDQIMYRWMKA